MKIKIYIVLLTLYALSAQTFSIARIHYGGGGDWYSDPSSIPNLLNYLMGQSSQLLRAKEVGQIILETMEEIHAKVLLIKE